MLFMSPGKNYQVFAIKEKTIPLADGTRQLLEPGYVVQFRRTRVLQPHEEDQARRTFSFRGIQYLEDMVTPIDPVKTRVSLYDSETAPDEHRERVEQTLLGHPDYGRDFVLVEAPKVDAPWPNYDQLVTSQGRNIKWVVEQIVSRVEQDGYDPEKVILYERYTLNRPEVIEALSKVGEAKPDAVTVAA